MMSKPANPRIEQWAQGNVNRADGFFTLHDQAGEAVALVGCPSDGTVNVEFLIQQNSLTWKTICAAIKEIEYYFFELGEADPWLYAQYHCTTAGNVYSSVQWSFTPGVPQT